MKKIFYAFLILCATMAFAACSDNKDESSGGGSNGLEILDGDPINGYTEESILEFMKEDHPFTWNGDWNDPNDPNYKAEGFNPMADTWWVSEKGGYVFHFTKDLRHITYNYEIEPDKEGYVFRADEPYTINDIAYRIGRDTFTYFLTKDKKKFYRNIGPYNNTNIITRSWQIYTPFDPTGKLPDIE